MIRTYSITGMAYKKRRVTRQKLVSFLKHGSCRVLVGKNSANPVHYKKHKVLLITASAVLIIGFVFVIF